jgi:GNAT superfamily N-acetyltransferase
VRAPAEGDIPAILKVMADFDIARNGIAVALTADDLRGDWEDLDLASDAWVVRARDGQAAAYATLTDEGSGHMLADGYVHPAHWGRGLGTLLAQLTERRAQAFIERAPAGARVVLTNGTIATDDAARRLFEGRGYTLARTFYRMGITLDAPSPAPIWPAGISVREFVYERDARVVFETVEEAFQDHWGHVPRVFEEWIARTNRPDFDPALWFLAYEGDAIAGVALCNRRPDMGWLNTLAVRRPWRQRGLGTALLRYVLGTFYQQGQPTIGLGVDGQNLTGALKLYEDVGMHPTMRIATYEKELRPGVDLSVRAIDA